MRDTAKVLLDQTDEDVAAEVRDELGRQGDVAITDLHVWRIGPAAHAAIVSVTTAAALNPDDLLERLRPVHELKHITVEIRTK